MEANINQQVVLTQDIATSASSISEAQPNMPSMGAASGGSNVDSQIIDVAASNGGSINDQNQTVANLQRQLLALENELKKVQGKVRENEAENSQLRVQLQARMMSVTNTSVASNAVTSADRSDAVTFAAAPFTPATQVVRTSATSLVTTSDVTATYSAGIYTASTSTLTNNTHFTTLCATAPSFAPYSVAPNTNAFAVSSTGFPYVTEANAAADVAAYATTSNAAAEAARVAAAASVASSATANYFETIRVAPYAPMSAATAHNLSNRVTLGSNALFTGTPQATAVSISHANAPTGPPLFNCGSATSATTTPSFPNPQVNTITPPYVDNFVHATRGALMPRKLQDLPEFSGQAEDWPVFVTAFEQSTIAYGYTNLENNQRLQNA